MEEHLSLLSIVNFEVVSIPIFEVLLIQSQEESTATPSGDSSRRDSERQVGGAVPIPCGEKIGLMDQKDQHLLTEKDLDVEE